MQIKRHTHSSRKQCGCMTSRHTRSEPNARTLYRGKLSRAEKTVHILCTLSGLYNKGSTKEDCTFTTHIGNLMKYVI